MIEYLLNLFGPGSIHKTSFIIKIASEIVQAFEGQFGTDKNAKDKAIDFLVNLLLSHKQINAPAPKQPVVPVPPVSNSNMTS